MLDIVNNRESLLVPSHSAFSQCHADTNSGRIYRNSRRDNLFQYVSYVTTPDVFDISLSIDILYFIRLHSILDFDDVNFMDMVDRFHIPKCENQ